VEQLSRLALTSGRKQFRLLLRGKSRDIHRRSSINRGTDTPASISFVKQAECLLALIVNEHQRLVV
jgi:hypothetical protein